MCALLRRLAPPLFVLPLHATWSIVAAEIAFVSTPGDMGQRLIAAMGVVRALSGDGRCSRELFQPSCNDPAVSGQGACGAPPSSFTTNAHVAHIAIARAGDADGPCEAQNGCTQGDDYFETFYRGDEDDPDPILDLTTEWQTWRAGLAGRPDHHLSRVYLEAGSMPADARR